MGYLEQLWEMLESGKIKMADTIWEVYSPVSLTQEEEMNDASNTK